MSEEKAIRVTKAAAEFNVSTDHIYETLEKKGFEIERKPTFKISPEAYAVLINEYSSDKAAKADADHLAVLRKRDNVVIDTSPKEELKKKAADEEEDFANVDLHKELDKIKGGLEKPKAKKVEPEPIIEAPKPEPVAKIVEEKKEAKAEPEVIKAKANLKGPKVLDKIELEEEKPSKGKKKKSKEEPVVEVTPDKESTPVTNIETPVAEETPKPKGKKKKKDEDILEQKPAEVSDAPPTLVSDEDQTLKPEPPEFVKVRVEKYSGPTIFGKIELPAEHVRSKKPVASSTPSTEDKKRKRKRKEKKLTSSSQPFDRSRPAPATDDKSKGRPREKPGPKVEPTEKEIQEQIKATLQRLSGQGQKSRSSKMRKMKREHAHAEQQEQMALDAESMKKIKVTEFVSANDLSRLMNLPVTQIISTCMSLGMFVSINQRLDAETITIVAGEFGYEVEFVSADVQEAISDAPDAPEDLKPRPPIITVMGHVDHGKTSLLDYIRKTNVIAGEAGGITQHIGAYEVTLPSGQLITFLDTPGHEAFTAMRARGAKVTDVAIIVVAADDNVMPQTIEAINHAQAAGVPIVFAINKIDKPEANPDRIREQLSKMNILVEEWGGKYQTQEISAKKGDNVEKLLDKVLVEAELLDLKANPDRRARGTIIESSLDKGRGYVTTMLVQTGTMAVGDVVLAGCFTGRVKALFNERGLRSEKVGPSTPVIMLGLTGSAQAGDQFNVMEDEREAREIANRRLQLQREQGIRTHKHITLDEIGRRLAIGNFKELNLIVKGDVDGSVEALSDSLLKLSNPEIQVNVIHKSVGQISESDVLLASASNAIIIGFQVRPSLNARKIAEQEQIDIRFYSVIYDAINEVKDAMEGMLAPEYEDKIVCNVEVRDTFKIPKAGTIAGCMVLDGKITRNTKVRIIRDGIVLHSGELASLKRFKDDVKEVASGYECGLNINNFNDVQVGDIIEGYETIAVKRTLA